MQTEYRSSKIQPPTTMEDKMIQSIIRIQNYSTKHYQCSFINIAYSFTHRYIFIYVTLRRLIAIFFNVSITVYCLKKCGIHRVQCSDISLIDVH